MTADMPSNLHLFVSYASADRDRVLAVAGALEDAGLTLWIDREGIPGGVSYGPEIVAAIKDCGGFLLMCSAAAFASRNVRQEIQLGWRFERPLLPLLLEPVTIPDDLAYWLEGAQWIELHGRSREAWLPAALRALNRFSLAQTAPDSARRSHDESGQPHAPPPVETDVVAHPSNLPPPLVDFIGRENELAALGVALSSGRLVTLSGAGGSGKTRLAIETARGFLPHTPDGVWLVELAAVTDPALVSQAVAEALGVREEAGTPLVETLAEHLRSRSALLVLDNCEHLVVMCSQLVDALLAKSPNLRIMTTSREPLGLSTETIFRVPVLGLPDTRTEATVESVGTSEAARLFVARAAFARPGFTLTDANAAAVAQICRRLDGIPLALELAAARIRLLEPDQLAERLDHRFRLLTGGRRTDLPRHQTLRGLIDWSYALLSETEATLFARLAVFAGGWTLEAAEMVGSEDSVEREEVLDLLEQLVDKSLISTEETESGLRFTILETLREYALERLQEADKESATPERHANFYLELSGGDSPQKRLGEELAVWLRTIDADLDNVRSALSWSLEQSVETGLRLASNLSQFWYVRGHFSEGRTWLERLFASAGDSPPALLGDAYVSAAALARVQGEQRIAKTFAEKAVAIATESGGKRRTARALYVLGSTLQGQGDADQAIETLEEALLLSRELDLHEQTGSILNVLGDAYFALGDHVRAIATIAEGLALKRMSGDTIGTGVCLLTLGALTLSQHDLVRAEACFEEALVLFRQVGDPENIATALLNLGAVAIEQGDLLRAASLCAEALVAFTKVGDRSGIAYALEGLARVAIRRESEAEGVRWLGATDSIRQAIDEPLPVEQREDHEHLVADARARLGEDAFDSAWALGKRMPIEAAMNEALALADAIASSGADGGSSDAVAP